MKRRLATLLVLMAMSPLLLGAGMAPPVFPPDVRLAGPHVRGVLVVDTHPDDDTTVNSAGVTPGPKAKYAAMFLQRGPHTSSAIFRLPTVFGAFLGCAPERSEERFAFRATKPNTLKDFIPAPIVDQLFLELGVDLRDTGKDPVITSIHDVACTTDPENPAPPQGAPGILSLRFAIQFIAPPRP